MAKGRRRVPPVIPRRDDAGGPVLPVPRPPEAGRFPRGPIPGHEPSATGRRQDPSDAPASRVPPVPAAVGTGRRTAAGPGASPGDTGTGTTTVSLPRRRPIASAGRARVPITLDSPKGTVSAPDRPAPVAGRALPEPAEPVAGPDRTGLNRSGPDRTPTDRARAPYERRKAATGRGERSSSTTDTGQRGAVAGRRAPGADGVASDSSRERSRAEHPAGGRRAEAFLPWYTAGQGDSLGSLAARLGTSVQVLARANGTVGQSRLVPGQRVFLPLPGGGEPARQDTARDGPRGTGGTDGGIRVRGKVLTHVLGRGESLEGVAEQHGVDARTLRELNRIGPGTRLQPGRRLVLPGPRPPRPAVPSSRPYTVRPQDTLAGIARATGTDLRRVLELNEFAAGDRVRPGLRILLPADPEGFPPAGPPDAVLAAAAANRAALAGRPAVPSEAVRAELVRIAARFGVEAPLALAVAYEESRFDQRRVSDVNAIGVMQVLPSCGAWVSRLLDRNLDVLDVPDNITTGVVLLAILLRSGDEAGALAGYYQGAVCVRSEGPLPDTLRYVARILRLRDRFAAIV
jgi:N-acetylmuramoyl-L-alanine amidase